MSGLLFVTELNTREDLVGLGKNSPPIWGIHGKSEAKYYRHSGFHHQRLRHHRKCHLWHRFLRFSYHFHNHHFYRHFGLKNNFEMSFADQWQIKGVSYSFQYDLTDCIFRKAYIFYFVFIFRGETWLFA